MGTLTAQGEIDPASAPIILCLGKKKSGKSKMAMLFFMSVRGDRLVIDINGTDGPKPNGKDIIEIKGDVGNMPSKWPEELRPDDGGSMTLYYHPDMGSPTFREDVDHLIGMAYRHDGTTILIHEMGILARANRTPPHTLRVLQSNRHHSCTLIMCAPRPHTMEPLTYGQSDLIYVFEMPNQDDRDTIANAVGWDRKDFALGVQELGPHEYLRCDTNESKPLEGEHDMRVVHVEALPAEVVTELDRLCAGTR